jgi:predicted lactoylglutathione lyase
MQNKQIYISVPVKDVAASTEFYQKIGFTFQGDWSMDGIVSCMKWSEEIYVVVTSNSHYQTYINGKTIVDAKTNSHSLMSLTMNSREEVDALVKIADENGGSHYAYSSGMDSMYNMMVEDLDGNTIEFVYMDMSKMTA